MIVRSEQWGAPEKTYVVQRIRGLRECGKVCSQLDIGIFLIYKSDKLLQQ
jgi:hypothetical protein